jgi:hypothetical protein
VSADPRKPRPHHAVLGLRITGGFLAGIELDFADGLNCLIGGRGTGKTTALEFLRFGLRLMPDPKISPQRYRAIEGLVKANLAGGRDALPSRPAEAAPPATGVRVKAREATALGRLALTLSLVAGSETSGSSGLVRAQAFHATSSPEREKNR